MCGGCNLVAESAGASVIVARYWWVARQGRKTVAAAEALLSAPALGLESDAGLQLKPTSPDEIERAEAAISARSQ